MRSVNLIVVGGLGNQMFQVATGFAYAKRDGVPFYIKRTKNFNDGRSLYWDSVLERFKEFLVDKLPDGISTWTEPEGATAYHNLPVVPSNGIRINGYFQSSKYFYNSKPLIRILLSAPDSLQERMRAKWPHLFDAGKEVVVVHARRTDYCKDAHMISFHGPLSIKYYQNAVSYMCEKVKSPHFLLVSDDNSFWSAVISMVPAISECGYTILESENDVETLALLQQFRHYIIANSTFSWWGAWLSGSKNVCAPSQWFGPIGPKKYEDIYEEEWTRIPC